MRQVDCFGSHDWLHARYLWTASQLAREVSRHFFSSAIVLEPNLKTLREHQHVDAQRGLTEEKYGYRRVVSQ